MKPLNPFLKVSEIQLNSIYLPLQVRLNECGTALANLDRAFAGRRNLASRVNYAAQMALTLVAHAFKIAATFVTTTCFFLSRLKKMRNWEQNGCAIDINRLSPDEIDAIRPKILDDLSRYMPKDSSPQKIESAYNQILSYYARSGKIYGPVVRLWVDHLLAKAAESNSSIVFLARDGIAPFEVAKELLNDPAYQARYPSLCEKNNVSLAFLSRKVIHSIKKDRELGAAYLRQLLPSDLIGTSDDAASAKNVMFVDIGFAGSMIEEIKNLMSQATEIDFSKRCSFHYLISHTEKANGFLGNLSRPLHDVISAGKNPAVYWLEDSHQTSIKSPSFLVRHEDGQVYPNTLLPDNTEFINVSDPLQILLRNYSTQAAIDFALKIDGFSYAAKYEALALFKSTLADIKRTKLPLFIQHI